MPLSAASTLAFLCACALASAGVLAVSDSEALQILFNRRLDEYASGVLEFDVDSDGLDEFISEIMSKDLGDQNEFGDHDDFGEQDVDDLEDQNTGWVCLAGTQYPNKRLGSAIGCRGGGTQGDRFDTHFSASAACRSCNGCTGVSRFVTRDGFWLSTRKFTTMEDTSQSAPGQWTSWVKRSCTAEEAFTELKMTQLPDDSLKLVSLHNPPVAPQTITVTGCKGKIVNDVVEDATRSAEKLRGELHSGSKHKKLKDLTYELFRWLVADEGARYAQTHRSCLKMGAGVYGCNGLFSGWTTGVAANSVRWEMNCTMRELAQDFCSYSLPCLVAAGRASEAVQPASASLYGFSNTRTFTTDSYYIPRDVCRKALFFMLKNREAICEDRKVEDYNGKALPSYLQTRGGTSATDCSTCRAPGCNIHDGDLGFFAN